MGNNPIPPAPHKSVEDLRIAAARQRYARGDLTLERFEEIVASILDSRLSLEDDKMLFSEAFATSREP